MTTRAERLGNKKLNEQHSVILGELLAKPENQTCADCPTKGPRWASWNLGCFICIRCSGIHRSIGVHITKVRSTNLDTWQVNWIESMLKWGNTRSNAMWKAKMTNSDRPGPQGTTKQYDTFIRKKYDMAKWKGPEPPPLGGGGGYSAPAAADPFGAFQTSSSGSGSGGG